MSSDVCLINTIAAVFCPTGVQLDLVVLLLDKSPRAKPGFPIIWGLS